MGERVYILGLSVWENRGRDGWMDGKLDSGFELFPCWEHAWRLGPQIT